MHLRRTVAAASLLAGLAFGEAITKIDPCPYAPANKTELHATITVTAQHQPVSTCTHNGGSFGWSTYDWVSTVVPCWEGSSESSCTVTKTEQIIPCTGTATTITSTIPTSTALPNGVYTTYDSTIYETVSKLWAAPYNGLGPFAVPGFEGCDLCEECGVQEDGSRLQRFNVKECTTVAGKEPSCSTYAETWVSRDIPTATGTVTAAISHHTVIPSAGVYTFPFFQPAPVTSINSNGQWYTVPAQPWTANIVESFVGPTTYDVVTTITKTVTYNVPFTTSHPEQTPAGSNHGWGAWQPAETAPPSHSPSDPTWPYTKTTPQPGATGQNDSPWAAWPTTTLSTTFSTTSTPTHPGGSPVETSNFYIELTYTGLRRRYTKRGDLTYVGFPGGSNDASVVNENEDPSWFHFDADGYLRTGTEYITGDLSSGYFVFEKTDEKPAKRPSYGLGSHGEFIRTDSGGFCATSSNFFITISGAPSDCKPVKCNSVDHLGHAPGHTPSGTPTTGHPTTHPTTMTTPTHTQPDISADLDVPEPTKYVKAVRRNDRWGDVWERP